MGELEAKNYEQENLFKDVRNECVQKLETIKTLKKKVQHYQKKASDLQDRLEKTVPGMNKLLAVTVARGKDGQLMCRECHLMVADALKDYPGIKWSRISPKLEL